MSTMAHTTPRWTARRRHQETVKQLQAAAWMQFEPRTNIGVGVGVVVDDVVVGVVVCQTFLQGSGGNLPAFWPRDV